MDLVVYYSRGGNTREVSEIIAQEKNAEVLEVKDNKNRLGALGFAKGTFDSLRGKKTNISYDVKEWSSYDTIYIGTPVWASKPAPAILEFIKENDFNNCRVVTFATMMGSGGESTVNAMNTAIRANGGSIKRSFALRMTGNDKKELVLDALKDE